MTMKLRTKLLLGYAGFVLALGVLGTWSARTLNQMSAVSGRIIAENYDSVVAAQDMKESLERQDSAALFELQGQHDRAARRRNIVPGSMPPSRRRRPILPSRANERSSRPSGAGATSTIASSINSSGRRAIEPRRTSPSSNPASTRSGPTAIGSCT
jgi:hypothetical protein